MISKVKQKTLILYLIAMIESFAIFISGLYSLSVFVLTMMFMSCAFLFDLQIFKRFFTKKVLENGLSIAIILVIFVLKPQSIVELAAWFLNSIIIIYLLENEEEKPYLRVYFLSLLAISLGLYGNFSPNVIFILFVYTFFSFIFLNLYTQEIFYKDLNYKKVFPFKKSISILLIASLFSLLLSPLFFVLIPRIPASLLKITPLISQKIDDPSISLKEGRVNQDERIALRINFEDVGLTKKFSRLYIFEEALTDFDGRIWGPILSNSAISSSSGFFRITGENINTSAIDFRRSEILKYQVYQEKETNRIYSVSGLEIESGFLNYDTTFFIQTRQILKTKYGGVYLFESTSGRRIYKATSTFYKLKSPYNDFLSLKTPQKLTVFDYSLLTYEDKTGKITELAKSLVNEEDPPYEKVLKILNYFKRNFKYTYDIKAKNVEEFLFKYKEGHCEYFASSMVLMLRSLKIPSQVAIGYASTEFDSNYLIVRNRDAHAWVQVYFEDTGFLNFDPTPSSFLPQGLTLSGKIQTFIDNIKFNWYKNVVGFDTFKQFEIFDSILIHSQNFLVLLRNFIDHLKETLILLSEKIITLFLLFLILIFFIKFLRRDVLNEYFKKISRLIYLNIQDEKKKEHFNETGSLLNALKFLDKKSFEKLKGLVDFYYFLRFSNDSESKIKTNKNLKKLKQMMRDI